MARCKHCNATLQPDGRDGFRALCDVCGLYTFDPATDIGFTGTTIKEADLVDALDVDAASIEHIPTGPWDPVFGGGIVPGSTIIMVGLPGAGKSTIALQASVALAQRSGKPAFVISGENSAAELRFNLDRLQIKLERGQIRLAKTMNSSGMIDDAVLTSVGVSSVLIDSITEICGTKQYDKQVALAKAAKGLAVRHKVPCWLVAQMNKSGDTMGMLALTHSADVLVEVQVIDDGRKRARILRDYGLDDGDARLLMAVKNRFGATHIEHPLLMTANGFTAIPKSMKRTRSKTGDPLRDLILAKDWLEEDLRNQQLSMRETREELSELNEKILKEVAKKPKPEKSAAVARRKKTA